MMLFHWVASFAENQFSLFEPDQILTWLHPILLCIMCWWIFVDILLLHYISGSGRLRDVQLRFSRWTRCGLQQLPRKSNTFWNSFSIRWADWHHFVHFERPVSVSGMAVYLIFMAFSFVLVSRWPTLLNNLIRPLKTFIHQWFRRPGASRKMW